MVNERRLSPSSHDVYAGVIKFFFEVKVGRPAVVADLVRRKVTMTLTLVPFRAQIAQLLDGAANVKHHDIEHVRASHQSALAPSSSAWS